MNAAASASGLPVADSIWPPPLAETLLGLRSTVRVALFCRTTAWQTCKGRAKTQAIESTCSQSWAHLDLAIKGARRSRRARRTWKAFSCRAEYGAFMEPRGCNQWQTVANAPAAETAKIGEKRCRGLPPAACDIHGKEGVRFESGRGLCKGPVNRVLSHSDRLAARRSGGWYGAFYGAFRSETGV